MAQRSIVTKPTTARKKFQGFNPGKVETIRTAKVQMDPQLEKALKMWEAALVKKHEFDTHYEEHHDEKYPYAEAAADLLNWVKDNYKRFGVIPSKGLIEKFTVLMSLEPAYSGFLSGPFISALMNESNDNGFVLHVPQRSFIGGGITGLAYLGMENRKDFTIIGRVSDVGFGMEEGSITIEGVCTDLLGYDMKGGRITIKGPQDSIEIGPGMKGGTIEVFGNLSCEIAELKGGRIIIHGSLLNDARFTGERGEIHIFGEAPDPRDFEGMPGVSIFHKGKLIAP